MGGALRGPTPAGRMRNDLASAFASAPSAPASYAAAGPVVTAVLRIHVEPAPDGWLTREALYRAAPRGGIPRGARIIIDIGRAGHWHLGVPVFLADIVRAATAVQIVGEDPATVAGLQRALTAELPRRAGGAA